MIRSVLVLVMLVLVVIMPPGGLRVDGRMR